MARRGGGRGAPALLGALAACLFLVAGTVAREAVAEERRTDAARLMNDLMAGKGPIGGPFTLEDSDGRRVSLADFRGRSVLLYFGYTFCPDVCPTDLLAMARLLRLMGPEADRLQPLMITLDPERDRAPALSAYAKSFDPRFVALRGSPAETRAVADAYKVFYEKVFPGDGAPYLVDHSAFIYLLDAEGRYVAFFPPGTTPERMATMIRDLGAEGRPGSMKTE
ncbi:MAG: SCO family protein [Rhodocyclaceae bacterium]|nr:SCO family protein [Rhodocyclaceae bacterium]